MINVGLIGSRGRMGQAFAEYAASRDDIQISAAVDVGDPIENVFSQQPDVVLDLSTGQAVDGHASEVVAAGLPYVIGATGISPGTLGALESLANQRDVSVLLVPNFSIGANLMMKFSELAATLMESAVITERHHAGKVDAPSGTALHTAKRINDAISQQGGLTASQEIATSEPGVMGGRIGGVAVHSIRGSGYLAEQSVQFSLPGETLVVEHRSIDRKCFMAGIDYAIRNIGKVKGFQIGLYTILDC